MAKRFLFFLLILSLSAVSCGESRPKPETKYFRPNTIGDHFQGFDDHWVLCNIFGDGVVRKVVFYEQEDKSYFVARKPDKDENDLLLGPKGPLAKGGLTPTLVDLTGDKVPEIVWTTSFHQANSLAVISLLGGPVRHYIEDVVLSCNLYGTSGNERIWVARPDDVTAGSVEVPYSFKYGKLLPDPFSGGEPMEFAATKEATDFEVLGGLWSKFFLRRLGPTDAELVKNRPWQAPFAESAKKLLAYIAWDMAQDQNQGDMLFLKALPEGLTNEAKTSLLFAHKAELALWEGDFGLAGKLVSMSFEASPQEPPPLAIRVKSFLLEFP